MARILANSRAGVAQVHALLDKNIPSYRQAYSDRTAWLMACLSELAYIKFNPLLSHQQQKTVFLESISKLVDENKKSSLIKLIASVVYDHEEGMAKLGEELEILKIQLLETFDSDGTQAILVSSDKFIALAFRGTEADVKDPVASLTDIKTDMKAKTTQCETGGNIHTGFKEAFDAVALDIESKLDEGELRDKPLFITGHSLGGALATIAAKKLSHRGGIAACYTFGSPRVGNDKWVSGIKSPIYRLVNAADCVTMLPPGDECITVFSWILKGIAWFRVPFISRPAGSFSQWLLLKFGGYLHGGNMRYMTNCESGQFDDVELLYSISFFRRIKGWFKKKGKGGKFLADHSIAVYRKKLMIIAEKRNRTK